MYDESTLVTDSIFFNDSFPSVSETPHPPLSHLRAMNRRRGLSLPAGDIPVDLLFPEVIRRHTLRQMSVSFVPEFLNELRIRTPTPSPRCGQKPKASANDGTLVEIKEDGEDLDNSTSTSSTKIYSEESKSDQEQCHVTIHGTENRGFSEEDDDDVFDESTHL